MERHLAGWPAAGGPKMVITDVYPHRLGWVTCSQSERYVRTRDVFDVVVGHGPFLVDGVDGSSHMVHGTADLEAGEWIEGYLEQVRGLERFDPLRSRIVELIESGQRLDAIRLVRASVADLGVQGPRSTSRPLQPACRFRSTYAPAYRDHRPYAGCGGACRTLTRSRDPQALDLRAAPTGKGGCYGRLATLGGMTARLRCVPIWHSSRPGSPSTRGLSCSGMPGGDRGRSAGCCVRRRE
ncbi:YrhB domain-containing protein [Amycolatopsis sp. NPDC049252]|uniref:YrhB domain-containing protein n=1 Tax=Amycolatopsis sp. NPDC049252 TaxID=3363933 RepID=UPI003710038F